MIRLAAPQIGEEECDAVLKTLRSGFLVQGETVREFERQVASYVGVSHLAAVSNGTAALYLALGALGIGKGDAVYVPAFTFPAVFNVVELRGARPVLVEVDATTYCMTPDALQLADESFDGPERPRAVIPVHEFGASCDMDGLQRIAKASDLAIIEDAACALGTTHAGRHVGTFGSFGCFSWHPRKGITTGEGGAMTTPDVDLHETALSLRNHGFAGRKAGESDLAAPSLNFRMTEFQAALGIEQLRKFPAWLALRRRIAETYIDRLRKVQGLALPRADAGHSWQTFMVVLPHDVPRAQIVKDLQRRGVEAGPGAHAIHMLDYPRRRYGHHEEDFPVARDLFRRGMAIPMHAGLSTEDVEHVSTVLAECVEEAGRGSV
jgi:perosamine synthetase